MTDLTGHIGENDVVLEVAPDEATDFVYVGGVKYIVKEAPEATQEESTETPQE